LDEETLGNIRSLWGNRKPWVQHQQHYALIAQRILGLTTDKRSQKRWRALFDVQEAHVIKRGGYRIGIMAELGRLAAMFEGHPERDVTVANAADEAVQLLRDGWTAKEIEAYMRKERIDWKRNR